MKLYNSGELLPGENLASEVLTATTGDLPAVKCGHNCTKNDCVNVAVPATGACAQCTQLTVYLPLGAEVVAIRYYTNAWHPNDRPTAQISAGEIDGWAMMERAIQYSTPSNTVVTTTFHNRSSDRDRVARLEVDWRR